jgi:hypothetical protein
MADLDPDERAELERLRREVDRLREGPSPPEPTVKSGHGGASRSLRWVGAAALLVVAALLGGLAVVAVYLRSQVLDTSTFVQTVAPLDNDPVVRNAVAHRMTDEIIKRSDLTGLATDLANRLEAVGAPKRLSDLVPPLVSGVSSFLYDKIDALLATEQFQTAFDTTVRLAHTGLVTVVTGGEGKVISSQANSVTIDLGALVGLAKQKLVEEGYGIFGKIPSFSLDYTLIQSDQLPKVRTYTRLLDQAGTWLPWVALVVLIGGVLLAPNRRRGIVLAFTLLGVVAVVLLVGISAARTYYVDNLPTSVQSPDAAAAVLNTMLRFLIGSLQTLVVVCVIFVVGALLAGPSVVAVGVRRLVNRGLDVLVRLLTRTGRWFAATGQALRGAYRVIQVLVVALAVVGFVLADRPGISAAIWTTVIVLAVLTVLELFVRGASARGAA